MRVLIWDDNPLQAQALARFLQEEGCRVERLTHYKALRAHLRTLSKTPVLLILTTQTLSRLSQISSLQSLAPLASVLVVCHSQKSGDHLEVLAAGADTYLIQPYRFELLLAQGRALLRHSRRARASLPEPQAPSEEIGPLHFWPEQFQVCRKKRCVQLNQREFALLRYLCQHPERVHSRQNLFQELWETSHATQYRQVDNAIVKLRQKLAVFDSLKISSVYGRGYRLQWKS